MQAVDQFNHLISLFSFGESHTFRKYYKKIAIVLMDFVLVNAYLHMKIYQEQVLSPKPTKKLDRKEFMENLIDSLTLYRTDALRYAKTAYFKFYLVILLID